MKKWQNNLSEILLGMMRNRLNVAQNIKYLQLATKQLIAGYKTFLTSKISLSKFSNWHILFLALNQPDNVVK